MCTQLVYSCINNYLLFSRYFIVLISYWNIIESSLSSITIKIVKNTLYALIRYQYVKMASFHWSFILYDFLTFVLIVKYDRKIHRGFGYRGKNNESFYLLHAKNLLWCLDTLFTNNPIDIFYNSFPRPQHEKNLENESHFISC